MQDVSSQLTRKQPSGESLNEFCQSFHVLSEDCDYKNVNAVDYRRVGSLRFYCINGLNLHTIRQCLLENSKLTADQTFDYYDPA